MGLYEYESKILHLLQKIIEQCAIPKVRSDAIYMFFFIVSTFLLDKIEHKKLNKYKLTFSSETNKSQAERTEILCTRLHTASVSILKFWNAY